MNKTLENKSKFFAQYLMQSVFVNGLGAKGVLTSMDLHWFSHGSIYGFLELKSLFDIASKDLDFVCNIIGEKRSSHLSSIGLRNTRSYFLGEMMPGIELNEHIKVVDYLRSKGYALPWMGLSVEKQIEYGWIKIENYERN